MKEKEVGNGTSAVDEEYEECEMDLLLANSEDVMETSVDHLNDISMGDLIKEAEIIFADDIFEPNKKIKEVNTPNQVKAVIGLEENTSREQEEDITHQEADHPEVSFSIVEDLAQPSTSSGVAGKPSYVRNIFDNVSFGPEKKEYVTHKNNIFVG